MRHLKQICLLMFLLPVLSFARGSLSGYCEQGGQKITTNAIPSTTQVMQSYPQCQISVFYTGGPSGSVTTSGTAVTWTNGTLFNANGQWSGQTITINSLPYQIQSCASQTACTLTGSAGTQSSPVAYSMAATTLAAIFTSNGTAQTNPFVSSLQGYWQFYSDNGQYDIKLSGGGIPAPFTWGAQDLIDPTSLPNTVSDLVCATTNCLSSLCITATARKQTLLVSRMWDLNGTCAASQYDYSGGGWCPSSGNTTVLSGAFDGDLTQHVCTSPAGNISFTGPVVSFFSQWFGAKCDGSSVDTVPLQSAIEATGARSLVLPGTGSTPCVVSAPGLFTFPANSGIRITGTTNQTNFNGPGGGLISSASSAPSTLLTIYSQNTHLDNLMIDGNSQAAGTGIVSVFGLNSVWSNVTVRNMSSDGVQIDDYHTPTTSVTAGGTIGSGAVTVASTTFFNGSIVFGSQTCSSAVFGGGTSNRENHGVTGVSGKVLTISGTLAHDQTTVQCGGNNNTMHIDHLATFTNGGWGFDVLRGEDNNAIWFSDHSSNSNTLGGELWTGSQHKHYGGNYQGDGGPAVKLGTVIPSPGYSQNFSVGMYIGPLGDIEESQSSFDRVESVCDLLSQVQFEDPSQLNIETGASSCFSLGSSTQGIGTSNSADGFFLKFNSIITGINNVTLPIGANTRILQEPTGTGVGLSIVAPNNAGGGVPKTLIDLNAYDSTGTEVTYAGLANAIQNNTHGSANGTLFFRVLNGGTLTDYLRLNNNGTFTYLKSFTVSTLPSCAGNSGNWTFVTDANSPTYNAVPTGSGSSVIPVFCDGSVWRAH